MLSLLLVVLVRLAGVVVRCVGAGACCRKRISERRGLGFALVVKDEEEIEVDMDVDVDVEMEMGLVEEGGAVGEIVGPSAVLILGSSFLGFVTSCPVPYPPWSFHFLLSFRATSLFPLSTPFKNAFRSLASLPNPTRTRSSLSLSSALAPAIKSVQLNPFKNRAFHTSFA
jgi:hypothetical protein